MIDRVLRGESPAEMPVEQIVRPELVTNPDVAREIGVSIPPDLVARCPPC